jgi:hypothetical protein
MGFDWTLGLMRYDKVWRSQRKLIHQKMNSLAVAEYLPTQLNHSLFAFHSLLETVYLWNDGILIQKLYESPNDFVEHLRHNSGALIMEECSWIITSIVSI